MNPQAGSRRSPAALLRRVVEVSRQEGWGSASHKVLRGVQDRTRRLLGEDLPRRVEPLTDQLQRARAELSSWNPYTKLVARRRLLEREPPGLVSVIMPTWNRGAVIEASIRSVLDQSYPNFELIVVDDGSTDHTAQTVLALAAEDKRVRFTSLAHAGVSAARNAGLAKAQGSWIAYLDTDNVWDRDFLLFMTHRLAETGAGTAYCALLAKGGTEVFVRRRPFDASALRRNNYIDLNCFMHTRELFDRMGGFDEKLRRWVDWDLILRFTEFHPPEFLPTILVRYLHKARHDQITLRESGAYRLVVLNKHLIDWPALTDQTESRPDLVSIIIPVYKGLALTQACIESIMEAGAQLSFEIVIVNNGCPPEDRDGLVALEQKYKAQLRVLECPENFGFALGNNLGVAESRGRYLILLNNDTEVHPGWMDQLIQTLREDRVGAVQPKLLYPDGTIQAAGLVFSSRSAVPYHIYRGDPGDGPQVNHRRDMQALTGACFAIRATDYIKLGGFNPLYRNGGEDIDLCFRLRLEMGKRLVYDPEAVVVHHESKTEGRGRYIRDNRRLFADTWREAVVPDDSQIYQSDGFRVGPYVKKGNIGHGDIAVYEPGFRELSSEPPRPPLTRVLKVGFVATWHLRGITIHALQMIRALEAGRFEVQVLARWEKASFDNSGVVHHPRVHDGGDDPSPEDTLAWVRHHELDAVLFMEVHPNDWKRIEFLRRHKVFVAGYENLDLLRRDLVDRYAGLDLILANTFYGHQTMSRLAPEVPGLLIPWGIPSKKAPAPLPITQSNEVKLLHVGGWGGLNNRKNTDLLIRAFAEAQATRSKLLVYSQKPLDAYEPDISRIANSHPRITVVEGSVPTILEAYEKADVVVSPSKREGLGLPIVEALAAGRPVVTSDGYMMKQWLIRDVHGWLCPGIPIQDHKFLPEIGVDVERLVGIFQSIDRSGDGVLQRAKSITEDRAVWLWDRQAEVLRNELARYIDYPGYASEPDLSYLDELWLSFEARRSKAEPR